MEHVTRKRFGQNFLQDSSVIQHIVSVVGPAPEQHFVEIGPGLGALTCAFLPVVGEMDVVELDRDLIPKLEAQCKGLGELRVHNADALKFDFSCLMKNNMRLRIVGNLPYNISTPLLFHLLDQADCINDMHFMLQKEVVERMAAKPGGKDYGRLSVMVQYHCQVEKLFIVSADAFKPRPKVDSAIVHLTPHLTPPVAVEDKKMLSRLVNQAFSQRRKTLHNSLKGLLGDEQFTTAGINPGLRAEQLSLEQFAALANQAIARSK